MCFLLAVLDHDFDHICTLTFSPFSAFVYNKNDQKNDLNHTLKNDKTGEFS